MQKELYSKINAPLAYQTKPPPKVCSMHFNLQPFVSYIHSHLKIYKMTLVPYIMTNAFVCYKIWQDINNIKKSTNKS